MEDLNELRKTAEQATPGPWTLEYENSDDWESGINDGDYPHTIHGPRNCSFDNWTDKSKVEDYLNRVNEISEMVDADAEFIATFDPPTVLALLSRLEQAERDLAIVRESQKELAKQLVATRTEQGKAEWKVTRVRYLSRYLKNLTPGDKYYAEMIDLALDGDTRRLADQGLGGGQDG